MKILVHLHLNHEEQLSYMINKLKNITDCEYDLYVTVYREKEEIKNKILNFKKDAKIIIVENIGNDTYPFIKIIRMVNLEDYDYVLKLNTLDYKPLKIYYGRIFKGFEQRNLLVGALIGSKGRFKHNLKILEDKSVGVLASKYFILSVSKYSNNDKKFNYRKFKKRLNIENGGKEFILGSMFMMRADILNNLRDSTITEADFSVEQNNNKRGTYVDGVDRGFLSLALSQGYSVYPVRNRLFPIKQFIKYQFIQGFFRKKKQVHRLRKIFASENIGVHKVITILGLKIKFKRKKLIIRQQFKELENKIEELNVRNEKIRQEYSLKLQNISMAVSNDLYKKNKNARILVCLHLFYMHEWDVIREYLDNLSCYNYDLIVTCVEGMYDEETLDKVREYKPDVQIKIYENQGYDIGAFIDILNTIDLDNYDIVYKLHSKGWNRPFIYIYNQIFKYKDWFYNLFNGVLANMSVHIAVDKLLNDDKTGIVAADNLIINDPKHKQAFTKDIANKYGIQLKDNYKYIAGSCFAIKAQCLKQIQNLHITINDFEKTKRGTFSLAHAMERIVCACIEPNGYEFYGIAVNHPTYEEERKEREKNSALRLLDDDRFEIDYDFFYKNLELKNISSYRITTIKLKDVKRNWHRTTMSLTDVAPYKFLQNGNSEEYSKYCEKNNQENGYDMNVDKFQTLIDNITNNGFDSKKLPIINSENVILDGQHRSCVLLHKYGPEYEMPVLEVTIEKTSKIKK